MVTETELEKLKKVQGNPKLFNKLSPLQKVRLNMVVGSAESDVADPVIRETVNEIANRYEEKSMADDQLMRGLVSPEEHKEILKRTEIRRQQFQKAREMREKAPREAGKQHMEFIKLLKKDRSMSPQEKRQEDYKMRNILKQETRKKLKESYQIEDALKTEGEFEA